MRPPEARGHVVTCTGARVALLALEGKGHLGRVLQCVLVDFPVLRHGLRIQKLGEQDAAVLPVLGTQLLHVHAAHDHSKQNTLLDTTALYDTRLEKQESSGKPAAAGVSRKAGSAAGACL